MEKDTSITVDYLVSKPLLKLYKPGEVLSIDFSEIEYGDEKIYMHGARDIISGRILWIYLSFDQTAATVLKHFKSIPNSYKIINTDHGSCYTAGIVQEYLDIRNIRHSMGRAGESYDNRWIEEIWKRIKGEWFSIYPTKNISIQQIQQHINDYIYFFNEKRLSIFTGKWTTPAEFEQSFVK